MFDELSSLSDIQIFSPEVGLLFGSALIWLELMVFITMISV